MPTEEIARNEWISFFDSFSKRHHNWLATVEVLSSDIGAQVETRELPLEGITAELGVGGRDSIQIMTGGEAERHSGPVITAPESGLVKQTPARSVAAAVVG